ncbi:WecB/TagA/CpsF family glycosyltransferase [Rathayibacter sp. VKM Ac-2801]|uniref:WecB/TagA/CpsF family glycosyltransferase n=1 Tax=Rathayibacter sp. VKM Ac-2801 TaxID=2609255 RepID=UPI0013204FB5|nr:WecB/TagA/CpsF family glycosyltransferase [Rathayibacter sp. VKM Ac-2801]QHC70720.1 WecB/TagA/CpsF family glycosyltransferase [Rathayibacter sp. VKM Ac-2801]
MTAAARTALPFDLGHVDARTAPEMIAEILAGEHRGRIIGNLNLHGLYMAQTDEHFRRFCDQADTVLIDGWPILALARGTAVDSPLTPQHRIGSTDWLFPLIENDEPLVVVAVGGTPESSAAAAEAVAARTSRMTWLAYDGFDQQWHGTGEEWPLAESLARADLVLVGMGMPRQERWILENRELAPRAAFANVGGCLDYIAGTQALAPRWMGALGVEWLFRLARDPRRLAARYLLEPLQLLRIVLSGRSRAKRTPGPCDSPRPSGRVSTGVGPH